MIKWTEQRKYSHPSIEHNSHGDINWKRPTKPNQSNETAPMQLIYRELRLTHASYSTFHQINPGFLSYNGTFDIYKVWRVQCPQYLCATCCCPLFLLPFDYHVFFFGFLFCFVLCVRVCVFFLIRWFHNQHRFDAVEWLNLLRARICNAYIHIHSVHSTRTHTTGQASWMGAAVLQHVEDHLKMDNGENIHRNLNEFNSNGWDSISFITDVFDWYAKKQLCLSPCGDECVLETISFIRTYVRAS